MPGLEMAIMKQGDRNIRCTCEGRHGVPAVGQTLLLCSKCKVWQHQPCVIGDQVKISAKKGFVCTVCKKPTPRKFLKSLQKRVPEERKLSPVASEYDYDENGETLRKKVKSGWIRQHPAFRPLPAVERAFGQPRRLMVTLNMRKAAGEINKTKPQPKATSSHPTRRETKKTKIQAVIPDERARTLSAVRSRLIKGFFGDHGPQAAEMSEMAESAGQLVALDTQGYLQPAVIRKMSLLILVNAIINIPFIPLNEEFNFKQRFADLQEKWNKSMKEERVYHEQHPAQAQPPTRDEEVHCDCEQVFPDAASFAFPCRSCKMLQHKACIRMPGKGTGPRRVSLIHCNPCRRALVDQQVQKMITPEEEDLRLREYCSKFLWKRYCNLPNGQLCSRAVQELTSQFFHEGEMIPVHPAPYDWINRVAGSIAETKKTVGNVRTAQIFGTGLEEVTYGENYEKYLGPLAWWMVHEHPRKGDATKLDILAEIVGWPGTEKGKYWRI